MATAHGGFVYTSETGAQGLDCVTNGAPSPVLLPNLVAGWALTSGPQQTLSSAGVISGGAADLTPLFAGDMSYGADGAIFSFSDSLLYCTYAGLNLDPSQNILITARISRSSGASSIQAISKSDTSGNIEYNVQDDGGDPGFWLPGFSDNRGNSVDTFPDQFVDDSAVFVAVWRLASDEIEHIQAANGTVYSNDPGAGTASVPGSNFCIGGFLNGSNQRQSGWYGTIGLVRVWIGPNAAVIAANASWMTWLSAGRTDAEVAAYTG